MKVGVVTGFIPLPVKHVSEDQYRTLGRRLCNACRDAAVIVVSDGKLEDCWAYDLCTGLPPANPVPADRYDSSELNVKSHIIQHNRTEWALDAADEYPDVDVWVWFDYGLLKQGFWKNNPVTEDKVKSFLKRVAATEKFDTIPFPGISDKGPVYPTGNNWRFCGSTHIWPVNFLPAINLVYKTTLKEWVFRHKTVPLDLPIWALVEQTSKLPFKFYQAEYDATQLDNFPGGLHHV
jgi:hypothetical protein